VIARNGALPRGVVPKCTTLGDAEDPRT
jgi:hypothetical protein